MSVETLCMIDECLRYPENMSNWERDCLKAYKRQIEDGDELYTRQVEMINDVWERVVAPRN